MTTQQQHEEPPGAPGQQPEQSPPGDDRAGQEHGTRDEGGGGHGHGGRAGLAVGVAGAVLVMVVLGALHALTVPPFLPADEASHTGYALVLAEGELPVIRTPVPETFEDIPPHRVVWTANHPPLYYHLAAAALTWGIEQDQPLTGFHAARLIGVALSAVTVALAAWLARLLVPGRPIVAVGAAAVTAMVPSFVHVSGLVHNDALAVLTSTGLLVAGVLVVQRGPSVLRLTAFGVLSAAAALTRASGLISVAVAALAVLIGVLLHGRGHVLLRGLLAVGAGALGAAAAAGAAGWFYLRNLDLYGDLTGAGVLFDLFNRSPREPAWTYLVDVEFWLALQRHWWGRFGGGWAIDGAALTLADWLGVLVLVGLVLAAVRWLQRGRPRAPVPLWLSWLLCGLQLVLLVGSVAGFVSQGGSAHGRYVFPAVALVASVVALGWASLSFVPRLRVPGALADTLTTRAPLVRTAARWVGGRTHAVSVRLRWRPPTRAGAGGTPLLLALAALLALNLAVWANFLVDQHPAAARVSVWEAPFVALSDSGVAAVTIAVLGILLLVGAGLVLTGVRRIALTAPRAPHDGVGVDGIPGPAARRGVPAAVWVLTAAFGLLLGAWSTLVPAFHGPDEGKHVDMVVAAGGLDTWRDPGRIQMGQRVASIADASGYAPGRAPRHRWEATPRPLRPTLEEVGPERPARVVNQQWQHPRLSYTVGAAALAGAQALVPGAADWSGEQVVGFLRLVNAALLLPLPLIAFLAARRLTGSEGAGLVAATIPFAIPQLAHIGSVVNNDALLVTLVGVQTLLLIGVLRGDLSLRRGALIGVVTGLALLTKGFALFALLWLPAVYAVAAVRHRRFRAAAASGAVAAAVSTVLGGWWWIRNLVLLGDVQPRGMTFAPAPERFVPDFAVWYEAVSVRVLGTFWGNVGWTEARLDPDIVEGAAWVMTGAIALALAVRRRRHPWTRLDLLLLLVPAAGLLAIMAKGSWDYYVDSTRVVGMQGRYAFPAITGMAVVVGAGAAALLGRGARWLAPVLLGAAVWIQYVAVHTTLLRYWGPRGWTDVGVSVQALLGWSPWGNTTTALPWLGTVVALVAALWLLLAARPASPQATAGRHDPPGQAADHTGVGDAGADHDGVEDAGDASAEDDRAKAPEKTEAPSASVSATSGTAPD